MMANHYEGSGEFPEILGNDRTMVEQGILVLAERTTRGRQRCLLLETPRIRKQEQCLMVYVFARDGSSRHDTI